MRDLQVICSDLMSTLNATLIGVYGEEPHNSAPAAVASNATLSDTDPTGAVEFTIAVVLLYGVGVIGLLGITARRNRRMELMDKEVNKFLKMQHRAKPVKRKPTPPRTKKVISKLIASLHFHPDRSESPVVIPMELNNLNKDITFSMGGTDTISNAAKSGAEKMVSMSLIHERKQSGVTRDIKVKNLLSTDANNGLMCQIETNPNIPQGSQNMPLLGEYLKPDSLRLEYIKEEVVDDYYSVKSESDSDLTEVCVITSGTDKEL